MRRLTGSRSSSQANSVLNAIVVPTAIGYATDSGTRASTTSHSTKLAA